MPNWLPISCIEPKTATRSFVFMSQELSTLRNRPSSALSTGTVKLPYMGMSTLQERLIEVADSVGNDAEVARIAKVSRSAVSQWRTGDVKALKAVSAVNIQERTGYSVRWLILGIGPKKLSGKQDIAQVPDGQVRLGHKDEQKLLVVLRAFFDTDDEGKNEIVETAKAIIGVNGPTRGEHSAKPRRGSSNR